MLVILKKYPKNSSNSIGERSELVFGKKWKNCISLQKIPFLAFFLELQNENGFLKKLFSIFLCSNLFSKLDLSCFKKPFSFCSSGKKAQKAIFWSEIQLFVVKVATNFSVQILIFFCLFFRLRTSQFSGAGNSTTNSFAFHPP